MTPGAPDALLHRINQHLGTAFSLLERYATGESGAYAVVDPAGRRIVLKWSPDTRALGRFQRAAATTELLLPLGYPVPVYRFSGLLDDACYAICDELPGRALGTLTASFLPSLLALNEVQAGRAAANAIEWQGRVVDSVLRGGSGFCLLEPLRRYSTATAELLATIQRLVAARADHPFETRDIVHFDFHPLNILVDEGTVSVVIDWDGCCPGDRTFDLATLLFYDFDTANVRDRLWRQSLEQSGPDALVVYLCHLILRQVDWSIRHHDARIVDVFVRRGGLILRDLAEHG